MPLRSGKYYSSESDIIATELIPDPDTTICSSSDSNYFELHSFVEQSSPVDNKYTTPTMSTSISPALNAFMKNPSKYATAVPCSKSNGSNFYDWCQAIDGVLMYIFNKMKLTKNFNTLEAPLEFMGVLHFFLQQTLSPNQIEMIQHTFSPKDAYHVLRDSFMKSS
ncbi:hypothetical protein O181_100092 [Austropuccinia psidii MF-1]|uniref:Uncharacterized protein n=1 Tax=Austropuccinia psidii MF-1 TaxID=1389203 RepID=A0A9Q3PH64_9BASI|nr:hypothetical protein [Austropuccinia psidii MF-1]